MDNVYFCFSLGWLLLICCLPGCMGHMSPRQSDCSVASQAIVDHVLEVRCPPLLSMDGLTRIHVSDYGAIPDDGINDYEAILAAVKAISEMGGDVELVFAPGRYEVDPGNGPYQTNEPPCILIQNMKNVVIDGQGAEILIRRPSMAFCRVMGSENIIVRNFSIDYDPLPFTQGTVVDHHPDGLWLDVEVDEGFPLPNDIFFLTYNSWSMFKDPLVPGKLKDGAPNHFRWDSFQLTGERTVRVFVVAGQAARIKHSLEIGDRYAQVGRSTGGCTYFNNDQVTFQNITYYACPSSLFSGSNTSRLNVINCRSVLKDGRLLVNGADGVHCQAARIGPWIEGCEFEGLSDDCLNIYAVPAYIREIVSNNQFRMTRTDLMLIGDTLAFFAPQNGDLISKVGIVNIDNDLVTVSEPVTGLTIAPSGTPFDSKEWKIYDHAYNLNAIGNYFVLRNNLMRDGRRYGVFIKASYGIIEDNRFERLSDCAICIQNIPDWPEGFFAHQVVIRNNKMIDCAFIHNRYPIEISFRKLGGLSTAMLQKDIFIENNQIRAVSGAVARISSVDGLSIHDNVLETGDDDSPLVIISNSVIRCMENNTDEERFLMTNVGFTNIPDPIQTGSLHVFPNPVSSLVSVRHDELLPERVNWRIYDLKGNVSLSGKQIQPGRTMEIDVSVLAAGLYLLRLEAENWNKFVRILKE